ncbi:MAG: GIY-YIG nuclease family protein [Patescibacteria group bacterium]
MKWVVYYIFSKTLNKYYIGKTDNIERKINEHNHGTEIYTKRGIPWILIGTIDCLDNQEATKLEIKLKKAKNPKYVKWFITEHGKIWTGSSTG